MREMKRGRGRSLGALCVLGFGAIGLLACGGGGGGGSVEVGPPFTLKAFQEGTLELVVTVDAAPKQYVTVTIQDPMVPPTGQQELEDVITSGVWYRGPTDVQGRIRTHLRIPSRLSGVDIIVHVSKKTGPYTYEALRTLWGITAPSSRIHVPMADLIAGTNNSPHVVAINLGGN